MEKTETDGSQKKFDRHRHDAFPVTPSKPSLSVNFWILEMANQAAADSSSVAGQGYQFEGEEEELIYGAASGWVEARTWCDHLDSLSSDLVHIPTPDTPCNRCEHPSENWLCLCCKEVLCSRFVNKHMLQHYQQTSHSLAFSYSDLSAWCFACDSYLDAQLISQLQPVHETAYILKFGESPPHRSIQLTSTKDPSSSNN